MEEGDGDDVYRVYHGASDGEGQDSFKGEGQKDRGCGRTGRLSGLPVFFIQL